MLARRLTAIAALVGAVAVAGLLLRPLAPHGALSSVAQAQPRAASVATDPLAVPRQFHGQILRKRVRHFPRKLLALTFDDGPNPQITPLVLKALRQYNAHATFFVLGNCARTYPALVKAEAAAGHAVESHSWSHPSSATPEAAAKELSQTAAIIQKLTGRKPQLFRPPYGITNGNLAKLAQKQGYGVVLWSISTADSNPIGPAVIARNVIHTPNPGDFVLMHDGMGHKASAAALPQVLKELTAAGYKFVTLPQLMQEWARWQQAQPKEKLHATR
jgi:peptidoglycan/xylan/chitin deacetylase (PgdA/CDA1 family)